MAAASGWDLPAPYVHVATATVADIDGYGHVNNAVYVRWLDEAAWSHSTALGIPPETCRALGRGMVVWRTQLNYLAPAYEADRLEIGTWILAGDGRLRVDRRFQVRHAGDGRTLLRALVHYVCADLESAKPKRMPREFAAAYQPLPSTAAALALEPHPFAPGVETRSRD